MAHLFKNILHPPIDQPRFWIIQTIVVALAATHLIVDISGVPEILPSGIPIGLLLLPIGYVTVIYGLSGAVATSVWAMLLWLPDLLLPHSEGHPENDVIDLAIVLGMAIFIGIYIEREKAERHRAIEVESLYHKIVDLNSSPILLCDTKETIFLVNPAAQTLFGRPLTGTAISEILSLNKGLSSIVADQIFTISGSSGTRDFRSVITPVHATRTNAVEYTQIVLQDVTKEQQNRDFAARLLSAQEEERQRIAMEVHDDPLQVLILIHRRLELLRADPAQNNIQQTVEQLRSDLSATISQLRSLILGLRPSGLEQFGLVAVMGALIDEIAQTYPIQASLTVTGSEKRLAAYMEIGAYRIMQEAVNNVLRHAKAHILSVGIIFSDNTMVANIVDDGCGFNTASPEDISAHGHLGIIGMRERASILGGEISFRSRAGAGTAVTFSLPIEFTPQTEPIHLQQSIENPEDINLAEHGSP